MVKNPRTPARPDQLRPLNRPLPLRVETEQGLPVALFSAGQQRHAITEIQDTWNVDDEWWREPIHRRYYRVQLDNGSLHTICADAGSCHEQRY